MGKKLSDEEIRALIAKAKKGKPAELKLKPWKTIQCAENGCKKPIHIDIVDEDDIEESGINPDFVEGDNWLHDQRQTDHQKYVPDHHILLSSLIFRDPDKVKVPKTLAHELGEVVAESLGLPYDRAHELVANPLETATAKVLRENAPAREKT